MSIPLNQSTKSNKKDQSKTVKPKKNKKNSSKDIKKNI